MNPSINKKFNRLLIARFIYLLIIVLVIFCVTTEIFTYVYSPLNSEYIPNGTGTRILFYFSFFTILSNIALAIGALLWLIYGDHHGTGFKILRLDGMIGVLITALVYHFIIRKVHIPPNMLMTFTNEGLHVVVPLLGLLGWLISKTNSAPRVTIRLIFLAVIPPFFYMADSNMKCNAIFSKCFIRC